MSTIKDKLGFTYKGQTSQSFGIVAVTMDSGMFEEDLVASRTINDVKLINKNQVLFTGIEKNVREFTLTLAFEKDFTDQKLQNLINWLYETEYYSPLKFDDTDRIYYCMPDGDAQLVHTGANQGYVNINMKTNSPYVFGVTETKEITSTTGSAYLVINNKGKANPDCIIEIKPNATSINLVLNGYTVQFRNLKLTETVKIYPLDEDIESSLPNVFHYSDYTGDLSRLTLIKGNNELRVSGNATVKYIFQPYYDK